MGDTIKQMLEKPIQLADQVIKACDEAVSFKRECSELKLKTFKLSDLLRQASRSSSDLYERPTRLIIDETQKVLLKTLTLSLKCRPNGLIKRAFTVVSAATFRNIFTLLDNSARDISWLLCVSGSGSGAGAGAGYLGLPPIAANEPMLCRIWEQITLLLTGRAEDRASAVGSLASLARENNRYGRLIIEEGGVDPLCRLLKEANTNEEQENAARAIGILGRDPENVDRMVQAGVCSVLAMVLKDGPMKVQATVAWAVSEFATNSEKSKDIFVGLNVVSLLVGHLAFETVEEHSKYVVLNRTTSIDSAMIVGTAGTAGDKGKLGKRNNEFRRLQTIGTSVHALVNKGKTNPAQVQPDDVCGNDNGNGNGDDLSNGDGKLRVSRSQSLAVGRARERELEDPKVKTNMKAMVAKALCCLAKDNSVICRQICESRALLVFSVLLEKGEDEVRQNSAMALMEITAVAEKDAELRRATFKPNLPACKSVVNQILHIIEKGDFNSDLLVPCVKAIGNLARTFKSTESRVIGPLVRILDEGDNEVAREAVIALTKFAGSDNYLHMDHSNAIIASGGIKHLVQLVYFGERNLQTIAVVLLSYIALHVPDSEELAKCNVICVLEWASKQTHLIHGAFTDCLLLDAKCRLELYQSKISR